MKTQMEVHTPANRKMAWIDVMHQIVSFQQIGEASCYSAEESDFWPHIMALVNVGYRLQ